MKFIATAATSTTTKVIENELLLLRYFHLTMNNIVNFSLKCFQVELVVGWLVEDVGGGVGKRKIASDVRGL